MELTDLHVHSTASDGTFTPRELVAEAKAKGLVSFALTDHDTVAGVSAAVECGRESGIEVIPGIEISCSYTSGAIIDKEVHIVGLFIDYEDSAFLAEVSKLSSSRDGRNEQIIDRMRAAGFDISMEAMIDMFGSNTVITRAHFARYMTEKGYVKDNAQAFEKYLGDGMPFFVPRTKLNPKRAIELIREAGGVAVLAHPILYNLSETELTALASSLKKAGLTGIEAIYSTYRSGDEILIRRIAGECGLLISGGSDFHGSNKPYIHLGIGKGNLKVPYELAVNLKKCARIK